MSEIRKPGLATRAVHGTTMRDAHGAPHLPVHNWDVVEHVDDRAEKRRRWDLNRASLM